MSEPVGTHGTAYMFVNIVQKGFDIHDNCGEEIISYGEHTLFWSILFHQ